MLEMIQHMDENALRFVQENLSDEAIQKILVTVTHLGDYGLAWLVPGIAMLCSDNKRKNGVQLLLTTGAAGAVNSLLIKNIVDRIRPFEALLGIEVLIRKPGDFSFPSGHTASSMAAAYAINKMYGKKLGIPAYALATAIGVSRVGVGVHYPSDVVVGAIVGSAVAFGVDKLLTAFWKRCERRKRKSLRENSKNSEKHGT